MANAPAPKRTVRYFVSYTRDDVKLPDKLLAELRKKLGADGDYDFQPWRDTGILVGKEWDAEIKTALAACDFGLLLVSPAFLGKKYITEQELPVFVRGDKPCVPVTLSRIDFDEMDLKGLEAMQFVGLPLPRDPHPRSFEECSSAKHQSAFAHNLYLKIKARLADLFADDPQPGAKPSAPGGIDEAAYRAHIRRHYRHLQLEALGGEQFYRDIELQQVFIPQDARDCREWLPEALEAPKDLTLGDADTALAELHEHKRFRDTAPREILALLDDPATPHRVILGAPGAGKSSLTRIRLLAWEKEPAGRALPVLVELRRFHRSGCADFLEYLATDKDLVFRFPADALRARLHAGTAELLFDGLDEIFEPAARDSVAHQIARYSGEFKAARLLVTSRLIGYPGTILRQAEFAHWLLADFDEKKVAAFLDHWTADAIREPGDRPTVRRRMEDALRNPVIRELAGNPLLLTLMAVLARKSDLPRDLGSLYARAADLLLEQWDAGRFLESDVEMKGLGIIIDQKDKRDLLRDLAWQMQTGEKKTLRGNLIGKKEVEAAMDTAFRHRIADDGLRRKAIGLLIGQLTERNYILCHVGGAQFAFVHRGFLEFFASEHLVNLIATKPDSALAVIARIFRVHAADDAWQEVLILAATRFESSVADTILQPLIKRPDAVESHASYALDSPNRLMLVCRVLARAREPHKFTIAAVVRLSLDKWVNAPDYEYRHGNFTRLLAETFPDEITRKMLTELAWRDDKRDVKDDALEALAEHFCDGTTRALLIEHVVRDGSSQLRAIRLLAEHFCDGKTHALLTELAGRRADTDARSQAIASLAEHFRELPETAEVLRSVVSGERGREVVETVAERYIAIEARIYLRSFIEAPEDGKGAAEK